MIRSVDRGYLQVSLRCQYTMHAEIQRAMLWFELIYVLQRISKLFVTALDDTVCLPGLSQWPHCILRPFPLTSSEFSEWFPPTLSVSWSSIVVFLTRLRYTLHYPWTLVLLFRPKAHELSSHHMTVTHLLINLMPSLTMLFPQRSAPVNKCSTLIAGDNFSELFPRRQMDFNIFVTPKEGAYPLRYRPTPPWLTLMYWVGRVVLWYGTWWIGWRSVALWVI